MRSEINRLLQSELDDVDGIIAVALVSTNGLPLGFVQRGNLNISSVDLSLFSTLMTNVINRIRRINPDSWFINFKHRVVIINGDQYSVIIINNNDLSIIAVFENYVDINILTYRLINDLDLLSNLISGPLGK